MEIDKLIVQPSLSDHQRQNPHLLRFSALSGEEWDDPIATWKSKIRWYSENNHFKDMNRIDSMPTTAQHCRLGLFQDSDFAGDLEDSKSTSVGILCIFGIYTSVPISWMCKKQTSVSDSSTEVEIISLDAGLRMDGIPALDLLGSID